MDNRTLFMGKISIQHLTTIDTSSIIFCRIQTFLIWAPLTNVRAYNYNLHVFTQHHLWQCTLFLCNKLIITIIDNPRTLVIYFIQLIVQLVCAKYFNLHDLIIYALFCSNYLLMLYSFLKHWWNHCVSRFIICIYYLQDLK